MSGRQFVKSFGESKKEYKKLLEMHVAELNSLQRLHYASNRYALLLIFQGMEAAGKDGAIRHVMPGSIRKAARFPVSNSRATPSWKAHRRTGQELEIQSRGHSREEILEGLHAGL